MRKTSYVVLLFVIFTTFTYAQENAYQLSSHILNITTGQPAADVKITLSQQEENGQWTVIDEKYTDQHGRVNDFLKTNGKGHSGIYKLTFHTRPYFKKHHQKTFYPFIEVAFDLKKDQHYHVPITLSPFGYSTYRGN